MPRMKNLAIALLAAMPLLACQNASTTATSAPGQSSAPAAARAANAWITLFDGGDVARSFRGFKGDAVPSSWVVKDGCLVHLKSAGDGHMVGGDLITRDSWCNFELELEWKVTPGGNSGIFYRASEDTGSIWENAPEMQILDDAAHNDGKNRLTSAGADYALYPAPVGVAKPVGQWNQVRILADGDHVQYFLNGVKTCDFVRNSADWKARVAASKFSKMPKYGTNACGHIGLQDHGDEVWFRNIRVKPLG